MLQPPQFAVSVFVFASQPVAGMPSQSSYGKLQLSTHLPALQLGGAFVLGHTCAQPPQLFTSVSVNVSQPFERRLLSQFAVPGWQVPTHWPPEQLGVMLNVEHDVPQPPQFAVLVEVSMQMPPQY